MKSCLLIDDDTDDQEIFKMCLGKINREIQLKVANNGMEAIEMLTIEDLYVPDYIFIDVNMPKMNGVDCLKSLKRIERLKNTRIFMYSTTGEKSSVEESKNLGADDFIIKPAKTNDLKIKLSKIFEIVSEINKDSE